MNKALILKNFGMIRERIFRACEVSGRSAESVTLLAVSKTRTVDEIKVLYEAGQRDFGENYAQELARKAEAFHASGIRDIRWHMIGHVQSNKVKMICPWISSVHSIDSEKVAGIFASRWAESGHSQKLEIFLEVNIGAMETKSGVGENAAKALAEAVSRIPQLELVGLMCLPSPEDGISGKAFAALKDLEERCRPFTRGGLSMGMTGDFEKAIALGATHVRIGTALFGERAQPAFN